MGARLADAGGADDSEQVHEAARDVPAADEHLQATVAGCTVPPREPAIQEVSGDKATDDGSAALPPTALSGADVNGPWATGGEQDVVQTTGFGTNRRVGTVSRLDHISDADYSIRKRLEERCGQVG